MKQQINEFKRMQQLAGLITESQLNENVSEDVKKYLNTAFEVYLEGGDTFEEKPGETHVFTMEGDEYGDPEYYDDADTFKEAVEQLNDSPIILNYNKNYVGDYGKVTAKSDGQDITISFIVPK
jgi:uncharacterized protein YciU (UPF0263 family)